MECADAFPCCLDGSLCGLSQQGPEPGADLFDRIEIGTAGRQKDQPCADSMNGHASRLALAAAGIVGHDDIASFELSEPGAVRHKLGNCAR